MADNPGYTWTDTSRIRPEFRRDHQTLRAEDPLLTASLQHRDRRHNRRRMPCANLGEPYTNRRQRAPQRRARVPPVRDRSASSKPGRQRQKNTRSKNTAKHANCWASAHLTPTSSSPNWLTFISTLASVSNNRRAHFGTVTIDYTPTPAPSSSGRSTTDTTC